MPIRASPGSRFPPCAGNALRDTGTASATPSCRVSAVWVMTSRAWWAPPSPDATRRRGKTPSPSRPFATPNIRSVSRSRPAPRVTSSSWIGKKAGSKVPNSPAVCFCQASRGTTLQDFRSTMDGCRRSWTARRTAAPPRIGGAAKGRFGFSQLGLPRTTASASFAAVRDLGCCTCERLAAFPAPALVERRRSGTSRTA